MRLVKKCALLVFVGLTAISNLVFSSNRVINGIIRSGKNPVSEVQVTDGVNIVTTDQNGMYTLEVQPQSTMVYYSLPSGYESPVVNGVPLFYQFLSPDRPKQTVDFLINKANKPQKKHAFILWADPQVLETSEFDLLEDVVADVKQTLKSFPDAVPVHAISAGDNVFDRLQFYDQYKQVISTLNLPFYQVIGNHDMDYNHRSNELSAVSFSKAFGPTHFSFNVGQVHYVVLKNVFYYGDSYRYMGYVTENQLQWLEKDLKSVRPGSTVVVSMHIPIVYGESEKSGSYATTLSNSVMNRAALYKILAPFNTHILAGHSHTQWYTQAAPTIAEHVHAAASGAWWQGEICTDGSPKAYTVYEVDGDSLSWYFKGVGYDKQEQFKVYKAGADAACPEHFIANVFNYDPRWKVEWYENGVYKGEMTRYWGIDPLAADRYQSGKMKKHSWISATETNHLFRALPEDKNARIDVRVVDRFGNVYLKNVEDKIVLYPQGAPEGTFAPTPETAHGVEWITSVSEARMYRYTPDTPDKSGASVLICPGGGYGGLAAEKEGVEIARWFNKQGITAFVLYYRMPFARAYVPFNDAKMAMKIIRDNAMKWKLKKDKIGVIGFSAGGHLAATLATHTKGSEKPAFAALIYPVISFQPAFGPGGTCRNLLGEQPSDKQINEFSNELHVTKQTPPVFLVHALNDDMVEPLHSTAFADSLKRKKVPCELVLYQQGGHGFGMRPQKVDSDSWPERMLVWLKKLNFVN